MFQPERRIMLNVLINLDAIPGSMNSRESAVDVVQRVLNNSMRHYEPHVIDSRENVKKTEEVDLSSPEKIHYHALLAAKTMYPDANIYEIRRAAEKISDFIKDGR